MKELPTVAADGKKLHEEWRQTVENLQVDIDFHTFKYELWPDELRYREKLQSLRRHGQ